MYFLYIWLECVSNPTREDAFALRQFQGEARGVKLAAISNPGAIAFSCDFLFDPFDVTCFGASGEQMCHMQSEQLEINSCPGVIRLLLRWKLPCASKMVAVCITGYRRIKILSSHVCYCSGVNQCFCLSHAVKVLFKSYELCVESCINLTAVNVVLCLQLLVHL